MDGHFPSNSFIHSLIHPSVHSVNIPHLLGRVPSALVSDFVTSSSVGLNPNLTRHGMPAHLSSTAGASKENRQSGRREGPPKKQPPLHPAAGAAGAAKKVCVPLVWWELCAFSL